MLGPHALTTPIFWGTGERDPLIRIEFAKASVEFLEKVVGVPKTTAPVSSASGNAPVNGLDFNIYPGMQHSSSPQELAHLKEWLKRVLPAKDD
jgi:predicted esterase